MALFRVSLDEADYSLSSLLNYAPLGHSKESDAEINQPLGFFQLYISCRAIGLKEFPFFLYRYTCVCVVRRVAQDEG